jgi:putative transposase
LPQSQSASREIRRRFISRAKPALGLLGFLPSFSCNFGFNFPRVQHIVANTMIDREEPPQWPHAPPHWTFEPGIYFVTASTYHREQIFNTPESLDTVRDCLLESGPAHGWSVKAWVILSNHYHILAGSPDESGQTLRAWLREFHRRAAVSVNELAGCPGRRVWMNFRESRITHHTSYLARLNYIHQNPVRHRLVPVASSYRWSSARWFESNASPGFVRSVERFNTDKVQVWDDF